MANDSAPPANASIHHPPAQGHMRSGPTPRSALPGRADLHVFTHVHAGRRQRRSGRGGGGTSLLNADRSVSRLLASTAALTMPGG
ncbi:MAG: hypothetical protein R2749_12850 [Acidimicrobiales bacterium]